MRGLNKISWNLERWFLVSWVCLQLYPTPSPWKLLYFAGSGSHVSFRLPWNPLQKKNGGQIIKERKPWAVFSGENAKMGNGSGHSGILGWLSVCFCGIASLDVLHEFLSHRVIMNCVDSQLCAPSRLCKGESGDLLYRVFLNLMFYLQSCSELCFGLPSF